MDALILLLGLGVAAHRVLASETPPALDITSDEGDLLRYLLEVGNASGRQVRSCAFEGDTLRAVTAVRSSKAKGLVDILGSTSASDFASTTVWVPPSGRRAALRAVNVFDAGGGSR